MPNMMSFIIESFNSVAPIMWHVEEDDDGQGRVIGYNDNGRFCRCTIDLDGDVLVIHIYRGPKSFPQERFLLSDPATDLASIIADTWRKVCK